MRRNRLGVGCFVLAAWLGVWPAWAGARRIADVAYVPGGSAGQLLDLYLPPGPGPAPLVLFTHGSGWMWPNGRDGADAVAAALLPRGYAVAGVAIRASTEAHFPAQARDILTAVTFLRAHAAQYRIDPARIAVVGESSGGWASLMAAVAGQGAARVEAAVAFYPPTDFLHMDTEARRPCRPAITVPEAGVCHSGKSSPESRLLGCWVVACPARAEAADPARLVSAATPPVLLLHGQNDDLVPYAQSRHFFEAMRKSGRTVTLVTLPRARHGQWLQILSGAPAVDAGATAEDSSGRETRVTPGWDFLVGFLRSSGV